MRKILILITFAVLAQAATDNGQPTNGPPLAKPRPADLDLTLDIAEESEDPPPAQAVAQATASHGWIYWAMGATIGAGTLGWFLKVQLEQEPKVTRSEQVFTDER